MLAVSLRTQIEQILAEQEQVKRASGNIKSFDAVFAPGSLTILAQKFRAFAFLAFDPKADQVIAEYIREGSLAMDSGPNFLVLFLLDCPATSPVSLDASSLNSWLELDQSVQPSHQALRFLFEPKPVPPLPGIAVFRELGEQAEVIYIPFPAQDTVPAVRNYMRILSSHIDVASRGSEKSIST